MPLQRGAAGQGATSPAMLVFRSAPGWKAEQAAVNVWPLLGSMCLQALHCSSSSSKLSTCQPGTGRAQAKVDASDTSKLRPRQPGRVRSRLALGSGACLAHEGLWAAGEEQHTEAGGGAGAACQCRLYR